MTTAARTPRDIAASPTRAEWRTINAPLMSLADVAESIHYGYTASASQEPIGPKFLRITDIVAPQIDWETVPHCKIEKNAMEKYRLRPGDIVIARTGATVGHAKLIRDDRSSVFASYLVRIRIDTAKADPGYVGRVVESSFYKRFVLSNVSGAAQPNANARVLSSFRLPIPPQTLQARIASIFSAYDDLIENNRRRIRLLEQAARMLYEEWFVRLRFPGHEHVRITNSVPDGWKTTRLGKVISELESGKRPRGGSSVQGVPSIGAENILGLGQYEYGKEKFIPADYFASMNKGIVKNRDVVIYKDGANIGRSSYFGDGFPHEKCAVNEHVFRLRAWPEIGQNFLCFWVSQDDTRQRIANLNSNTAQPGVSRAKIETLSFTQPAPDVLRRFNDIVEPFIGQIFLLARTCQKLSKARDHLLSHVITKIA